MTENTRLVLDMLARGKITTEEADRLINALREPAGQPAAAAVRTEARPKPRYIRVIIDSDEDGDGPTNVNIRVPLQLLRAGVRLASLLPGGLQTQVNDALREEGVNFDISKLKPENLDELIDELQDASIDIAHRENTKIRIFTE